jgi:hypothetical protein
VRLCVAGVRRFCPVAGLIPGSLRHSSVPAVVAICCRTPVGGKTTTQRRSAAPGKLGLAQVSYTQDRTRRKKHIILDSNKVNILQVRMDPTISHPNCGGRSPSAYYDDIQQGRSPQ